ncbi:MAG TPA: UDP-N-acetylmuramate dehydrogenase [Candidatus Paceibacterota bacterium]|nr:UDP-N-acetylmuramate dehydrogenase [Candidatus Paceibacterota bacterium]
MDVKENVLLAPLTTFAIGGPARYFVEVASEAEVRSALGWARQQGVPFFVMAGGSNVLVPDAGLDGLVIRFVAEQFDVTDTGLEAQAGCNLLSLIRASAEAGLGGWEKLSGIPGTIGGAVRGNAGAFGPEIKDFVTWVRAINTKTEDVHEFSNAECEFDYRMSYFKKNPEWIILDVHVQLGASEPALIDETIREREKRHIQNVRAAGSYFMNPVAPLHIVNMFEEEKSVKSRGGRVPAGWLIDKAGLKGAALGGAQVSPQQANYIINTGTATAEDVRELAQKVKDEVRRRFDVALMEEAVVL